MKAVVSNDCRARIDRVPARFADHLDADLSVAELAAPPTARARSVSDSGVLEARR